MDTGKSALGLDGNVAAALGYPIGVIAIICLVMEKDNRFVKFHALQSILLHVAFIVLAVILVFVFIILAFVGIAASAAGAGSGGGLIGGLMGILSFLIWMVMIVLYILALIISAVKAYGGAYFTLPMIGNMAEKFANK